MNKVTSGFYTTQLRSQEYHSGRRLYLNDIPLNGTDFALILSES